MAKRFTDTEKYKKPFTRGLQGAYKLLWDYLYHDCDHAGIWIVDFEIAQIYLGSDMPVDKKSALEYFNSDEQRIIEFSKKEKWFIPGFVDFQYGKLNPKNKAHNSVIKLLEKYNLFEEYNKGLTRGLNASKDKDKELDKDMDLDKESEKKSRLLQSLKEGMIQTWQYLEQFPELELKQDAIEVIISLREARGSLLEPGKAEIESLISNWLFGGVEKEILLKMIKGAASDEFEVKNLTIEYILKPKHREKLLMKAEEIAPKKSKNSTESENIEDHQLLIKKEKEENEQYFLATVDQKLKIVLKAIKGYGPYQLVIKEDSYKDEVRKRITEYIKSNDTERSTVMIGVNAIVTSYMAELLEE